MAATTNLITVPNFLGTVSTYMCKMYFTEECFPSIPIGLVEPGDQSAILVTEQVTLDRRQPSHMTVIQLDH